MCLSGVILCCVLFLMCACIILCALSNGEAQIAHFILMHHDETSQREIHAKEHFPHLAELLSIPFD